jgi:GNAT superfamily N-acetyltransferase
MRVLEIKELENGEIPKLIELYGEVCPFTEDKESVMEKLERDLKDALGNDHMLIALENEKVIAFSWAQIHEDKKGRVVDTVKMLLISPSRYGMGIGGQLMEKEREYARYKGVDVLDIDVR